MFQVLHSILGMKAHCLIFLHLQTHAQSWKQHLSIWAPAVCELFPLQNEPNALHMTSHHICCCYSGSHQALEGGCCVGGHDRVDLLGSLRVKLRDLCNLLWGRDGGCRVVTCCLGSLGSLGRGNIQCFHQHLEALTASTCRPRLMMSMYSRRLQVWQMAAVGANACPEDRSLRAPDVSQLRPTRALKACCMMQPVSHVRACCLQLNPVVALIAGGRSCLAVSKLPSAASSQSGWPISFIMQLQV